MEHQNKRTPLHAAAESGHVDICHMLIQVCLHFQPSVQTICRGLWSALHGNQHWKIPPYKNLLVPGFAKLREALEDTAGIVLLGCSPGKEWGKIRCRALWGRWGSVPKRSQSWALPDVPVLPAGTARCITKLRSPSSWFWSPSQVALGDEGSEALEPGSCQALSSLLSKPEELQQAFSSAAHVERSEGEDASLIYCLKFGF